MILFAAYMPSIPGMAGALVIELILLGVLAWALIAYARQYCGLKMSLIAILGSAVAHVLVCLILANWNTRSFAGLQEILIAFFELWIFPIVAGVGMVFGALTLAMLTGARQLCRWGSSARILTNAATGATCHKKL